MYERGKNMSKTWEIARENRSKCGFVHRPTHFYVVRNPIRTFPAFSSWILVAIEHCILALYMPFLCLHSSPTTTYPKRHCHAVATAVRTSSTVLYSSILRTSASTLFFGRGIIIWSKPPEVEYLTLVSLMPKAARVTFVLAT